ncbi:MAG: tRNA (N6-isopentenyl adenosine(37)-C2)-methylthiotransferase MiaB [Bacilli bacterium]|nr:tRNA (N6-isopentenyl adenosine(37)-C2)-methylthiotransferase MiaB [Bacilli bacterium]
MGKKIYKSLPDMAKARNRVDLPVVKADEIAVPPRVAAFAQGRSYLIKTFGCQANVRDEEIMAGYLEKAGFCKANDEKSADLVIVNTCAVRENAEEKVYGEIGKFKANHLANRSFVMAVCGCMMQEEKMAEKVMATYPYVNLIFGTHNLPQLLNLLDEHLARKKDLVDVISYPGDIVENLPSIRLDPYKAFVNITYGCDKFCTYCIVPYTRGRERSRAKEEILAECKALVEEGYQEITLLGQNVNSYGKDFKDGTTFATILEEVAKLGIPRLRFMTSHPWDFDDAMLEVIGKYPNIMPFIHLPLQSGSDEILKKMGRRYSQADYLDLVRRIKEKIPGCALSTDIIVGFPNETEEDFQETLKVCEAVGYDSAFTFIYSPRKGTPAAAMVDGVSSEDKHRRFKELVSVIEKSVSAHALEMVGHTYRVLVDGPSKKNEAVLSGYTETNKLVHFQGPTYLKGHIVEVKITESHTYSLLGELCDDPLLYLAKDLSAKLHGEEASQRYFQALEAYRNDPSVAQARDALESAQRQFATSSKNGEDVSAKKKAYLEAKQHYENHPLVQNLQAAISDLKPLLEQVEAALK